MGVCLAEERREPPRPEWEEEVVGVRREGSSLPPLDRDTGKPEEIE